MEMSLRQPTQMFEITAHDSLILLASDAHHCPAGSIAYRELIVNQHYQIVISLHFRTVRVNIRALITDMTSIFIRH